MRNKLTVPKIFPVAPRLIPTRTAGSQRSCPVGFKRRRLFFSVASQQEWGFFRFIFGDDNIFVSLVSWNPFVLIGT